MAKPINLPLATVIEKGRKAYLAGKLSAQGPTPTCAYSDQSGRPCIIGAALTPHQRQRLDAQAGGVWVAQSKGLIETDDLLALSALQVAHDGWAGTWRQPLARDEAHAELRRLLGLDPA